jgi:hypothetical protein
MRENTHVNRWVERKGRKSRGTRMDVDGRGRKDLVSASERFEGLRR